MRHLIEMLEFDRDPRAIIATAKTFGFSGFGGLCGEAAIAINRVVFEGRGELVGAFNETLYRRGYHIGHIAVHINGVYWDADGVPKEADDIEAWAMLDPHDSDYAEIASKSGEIWDDETASAVTYVVMSEDDIMDVFGFDNLARLTGYLISAKNKIS